MTAARVATCCRSRGLMLVTVLIIVALLALLGVSFGFAMRAKYRLRRSIF